MSTPLNLLHFTDPHLFADRAGTLRGVRTHDTLLATLAGARQDHWPPDAILVTGDIAQDESREAYAVFRDCFAGLGVPVLCVPGNHDNPQFMREALAEPPFQYCGHWARDNWIVVMLDSHNPGKASGLLSPDELQRLRRLLVEHPRSHFLVALHHHPVPTGSRWLDTVPLRNPEELFAITDAAEPVQCLLWGHVHQAFDARRESTLLAATPSTCGQFRPHSVEFQIDEDRPPAYRWLRLYDDGTIATSVRWCEHAPA